MKKILLMILLLACMLPAGAQEKSVAREKIVLRLMGDSTMADKDLSYENPERGWGQRLPSHLDNGVEVYNYARNGRSTKSFQTLGEWDKVKADLREGDYLFIQFGHNDSKEDDPQRSAPAFGLYQENLRIFIDYALSVGARPILFTPVSRRWFDDEGRLKKDCHGDYPAAVKQVAQEYSLPLIDANAITQAWLESIGDEASRPYYMWVEKGTCPRHPDGKVDNTHTSIAGARKIVELLLPDIVRVIPELASHVDEYDFVVAKDGSGDFFTVQDAVNAAPDYCRMGTRILIREGIYREKVTVPANKRKLNLVGRSAETTVISYDDYAQKTGVTGYELGTSATSTVFVYADDFLAEGITFENTAGEGKEIGQACAITVDADRAAFLNCRFVANQDTIYTYGKGQRQYFRNCHIEGTTDFIFGASTVFFDNCTILSKKNSYITAASTPKGAAYGYVFSNCRFIHAEGVDKVYLGRPWRPYARTVIKNCYLDSHILKEGWHNWNKPYAEKTTYYAEYGNEGPGAAPQKDRVRWSHGLKPKEAAGYLPCVVLDAGSEIDRNGFDIKTEWYFKVF